MANENSPLNEIGFPEFTAKLVTDVFDALLGATLRQMEAYSELVAATAKTLDEYADENKESVSGEEVWDWLVTNLPGPAESVTAPTSAQAPPPVPTPEDATLVKDGVKLSPTEIQKVLTKTGITPAATLDKTEVEKIVGKVREKIAGNRYTLLKEMVKMGVIRLVVDYGEIETKLTFITKVLHDSINTASTYNAKNFNITGKAETGKKINKWVKASVAANYSSLGVRTTSSIDRDVSGSTVDIYARVYIRFKSDYQALGG